jgi:hypothetical protein
MGCGWDVKLLFQLTNYASQPSCFAAGKFLQAELPAIARLAQWHGNCAFDGRVNRSWARMVAAGFHGWPPPVLVDQLWRIYEFCRLFRMVVLGLFNAARLVQKHGG